MVVVKVLRNNQVISEWEGKVRRDFDALNTRILEAIREADREGRTPSYRELVAQCRVSSTSVVRYHILHLAGRGMVEMGAKGHSRSYRLTPKGRGYPSDGELLARCLAYLPDGELLRAIETRLGV